MMRITLTLLWLGLLIGAVAAPGALADEPEPGQIFFDPAVMVSAFVTDKGEIRRETPTAGAKDTLDVHTGDFNWIAQPSLAVGYDWGGWQAALRAALNAHFADFNLPDDHRAAGTLTSLEIGPDLYATVGQWRVATLELGGGLAARFLAGGDLDYRDAAGEGATLGFTGASSVPGFAMHLGATGALTRGPTMRLGWMFRLTYGSYDLEHDGPTTLEVDGERLIVDRDRFSLNVYSALIGLRLRFLPWAGKVL
jgi:hypothetical protein